MKEEGGKEEVCIYNLMREIETLYRKEGDEGFSPDDITKRGSIRVEVANRLHMEEILGDKELERND